MATTKDLINKVLRGMRQYALIIGAANDTDDDYLLMILQFVNEAKEEIEESGWAWQALRQTVTITLSASTVEYDVDTAGAADVDTNDRSRLLYANVTQTGESESFRVGDYSAPQMFNTTTSNEYRLKEISQEKMERWHFMDSDETGQPTHFSLYQDGTSLVMKVYPTPDATYTLKARIYIPQDELASTDLTTVLSIPSRPVYMKALWKANAERGSELGAPDSSLWMAYLDAHGFAVANEQSPDDETVTLDR